MFLSRYCQAIRTQSIDTVTFSRIDVPALRGCVCFMCDCCARRWLFQSVTLNDVSTVQLFLLTREQ